MIDSLIAILIIVIVIGGKLLGMYLIASFINKQ
jgi:hypothetical protein